MNDILLEASNLNKTWWDGAAEIRALNQINFHIRAGDKIAILGPSGSGKSTLLHLLGGLDKPTSGDVCLHGISYQKMSEKKRSKMRNQYLGFVYQFHHLLPELTALENTAMPLLLRGESVRAAEEKARLILSKVGLQARLTHKPSELSGGERQRVAISRALVHKPSCLLADEPTGNLDSKTASATFELMLSLNHEINTALVIVTHDEKLASKMGRIFFMQDGCLSPDSQHA